MSNYETKPLQVKAFQLSESNASDVASQLGASSVSVRHNLQNGEDSVSIVIPGSAPLDIVSGNWVVLHPEKGLLTMSDEAFENNYSVSDAPEEIQTPGTGVDATPAEAPLDASDGSATDAEADTYNGGGAHVADPSDTYTGDDTTDGQTV